MAEDVVLIKVQIDDSGAGGKTPEKTKKEVDGLATSILGLQQANKKLRDERKLLDTTDAQQSKRIREINALIDANDKAIKSNSSSLEKQRLNIGNYTGALDKLVPGLGATIEGIGGMTRASLAFIATPIGAVIAALGVALGALVAFLKNSTTGMDFLEDAGAAVGAVFNVLIDRVTKFVGGFIKIINGDFVNGVKDINGALSGIGDELERDIRAAIDLKAALRDLEDAEIDYKIAAAETENQIKRLILQSKNRTLSEKERIALIDEAVKKEKELNETKVALAEEELRIANETAAKRLNINKAAAETQVEFGKRIIAELKKDGAIQIDDERDKIAELLVAREEAEGSSIAILEKSQAQKDALEEKAREERKKREEEEIEEAEEKREQMIADYELELERRRMAYEKAAEYEKTFNTNREEENKVATTKGLAWAAKALEDARKKKEAADKKANAVAQKNREDDLAGQRASVDASLDLAREAFGRTRALAIAETVINTVRGMVRAIAEYPFPYSAIVAALVGAMGTIQTARIAGMNFRQGGQPWGPKMAKGGYFNLGGNRHEHGGTKFIGSDGTRFEAEKDEGIFILKREANAEFLREQSDRNQRHGGNAWIGRGAYPSMQKFANGGQLVASQTRSDDSNIERTVRSVMDSLPPIYVVAQDVSEVLDSSNQVKSKAQVI